jgi:hypothetical protein
MFAEKSRRRRESVSGSPGQVSQSIEKLVTLATLSPAWREKILADPLAAAAEAKLELSDSERAIIVGIPRATLEKTIDGMKASGARAFPVGKLVAGTAAAAAALLATTSCTLGHSAVVYERPVGAQPTPLAEGASELERTLARARASGNDTVAYRAVMAVFPHPDPPQQSPSPIRVGISIRDQSAWRANRGNAVLESESDAIRDALRDAGLLRARVIRPGKPLEGLPLEDRRAAEKRLANYENVVKKYDVGKTLPAVVFLAPDGSVLKQVICPTTERELLREIESIPPLLAAWITAQRRPQPSSPATDGIRPDRPKGARQ